MRIPEPGDFFVTEIKGRGHKYVTLAQAIIGDASRYSHAGIVLDNDEIIEAMPGGAIIASQGYYREIKNARVTQYSKWTLTDTNRENIVREARKLEGTKYSWLDYVSLGLTHTLPFRPNRLRKYIANTGHMICSQLVDEVYYRAGLHMFADKRWSGDVTPGDLSYILNEPEEGVSNG